MKRDMISIETKEGIKLKVPAHVVASTFIAAALAQVGVVQQQPTALAAQAPAAAAGTPAVGDYWPGQGGYNGGFVPARDGIPAHYLIIAAEDTGSHEWGGYGKESGATSKCDGLANTKTLLADGGHPAASACAEYQADGHDDFYLPAAAELYHCWLHIPTLLSKDCWYWSSTQRSALNAFHLRFGGGSQYYGAKGYELRVRPVRSVLID